MKLDQQIVSYLSNTEYLKQYVNRYDIIFEDHEIFLYTKPISDTETQYDIADEIDKIEEVIGFTITLIDDVGIEKKKLGNPFP